MHPSLAGRASSSSPLPSIIFDFLLCQEPLDQLCTLVLAPTLTQVIALGRANLSMVSNLSPIFPKVSNNNPIALPYSPLASVMLQHSNNIPAIFLKTSRKVFKVSQYSSNNNSSSQASPHRTNRHHSSSHFRQVLHRKLNCHRKQGRHLPKSHSLFRDLRLPPQQPSPQLQPPRYPRYGYPSSRLKTKQSSSSSSSLRLAMSRR